MSDRSRRRQFLRHATVLGTGALAGCAGLSNDGDGDEAEPATDAGSGTPTDDEPTDTATGDPEPTFDVSTTVETDSTSRVVTVEGTVAARAGIEGVDVSVGDETEAVDGGGGSEQSIEFAFPVDGGQSYAVEVVLVDGDGETATHTTTTDHVPLPVDPIDTDRLVGAHYYPWWGSKSDHTHREGWVDESTLDPVLGEYDAHDPAVIDQHLQWCLDHGIGWLSISWWGPYDYRDEIIRRDMPRTGNFERIQYSILYETTGRFRHGAIDMDLDANRRQLRDDLAYLAEHHFARDNYLHIDGRPVLFVYVAANLTGDVEAAFDEAADETGVEPYLLADLPPTNVADFPVSAVADGVTAYNAYDSREDIQDVFHDLYERSLQSMNPGASAADADFVPVIIPGFDDTEITHTARDNPPLPPSPERFARCCDQLDPHLGDAEAVLVTSFNEWYESTAIEPSEQFGTGYLELTADRLATGESSGYEVDGTVVELDWETAVNSAELDPESSGQRELSFMCHELRLLDGGGDALASYDVGVPDDEPVFVAGAYGTESHDGRTWRWFGTLNERTTVVVDAEADEIGGLALRGSPATEMAAEVRVGERAATVDVSGDARWYRVAF